jgi:hypothetical protein
MTNPRVVINTPEQEAIKEALYAFCKQTAYNLDNKKGLVSKYFKIPSFFQESNVIDHEADKIARRAFLERPLDPDTNASLPSQFDRLFDQLMDVLQRIEDADIDTIGRETDTVKETENAKEFLALIDKLNQMGFYHVNGKPVAFWSGRPEGQQAADNDPEALSNSAVPATLILSQLGELLKEGNRKLSDKLFRASSVAFSKAAAGKAKVHSSASSGEEMDPRANGDNFNMWNELPVVQNQRRRGRITEILFFHYIHATKTWGKPINMNTDAFDISKRRNSMTDLMPSPSPRGSMSAPPSPLSHASSRLSSSASVNLMPPPPLTPTRTLSEKEKREGEQKWNEKGVMRPAVNSEFLRVLFRTKALTAAANDEKDEKVLSPSEKSIALGLAFCKFFFKQKRLKENEKHKNKREFEKINQTAENEATTITTETSDAFERIKAEAAESAGRIQEESSREFDTIKKNTK